MKYQNVIYKNKKLKRINRQKAFNIAKNPKKYAGIILYMLPINANPDSPWFNGFEELEMNFKYMDAIDNMTFIQEYKYYNCVEELGSYLKFYIEAEA
jgi:hypothetical protein